MRESYVCMFAKRFCYFPFVLLLSFLGTSCIRKEAPNMEADILSVKIEGLKLLREAEIGNYEITIYAMVDNKDELTALKPTFTLTPGATITPASGEVQNFTEPVTYVVTAEDGKTSKEYKISVNATINPDSEFEANIIRATAEGIVLTSETEITDSTVKFFTTEGSDVTKVRPFFILSEGATITPENGIEQDFSAPIEYTVTSKDGKTNRTYTVSVEAMGGNVPNPEANILSASLEGVTMQREPIITQTEVKFYVKAEQNITSLKPIFTLSEGASINPKSGMPQDFSSPVKYTVTAKNSSTTKVYIVSVIASDNPVALSDKADILSVSINGFTFSKNPKIQSNAITMYCFGWENLTALKPTFTLSPGATITPANGTVQNFTQPVTYTVTAEDGKTTKTYKVAFNTTATVKRYSFEKVRMYKNDYQILIANDNLDWESSNGGFWYAPGKKRVEEYPVLQDNNGYKGKCAKLITRPINRNATPLAGGSLYLGRTNWSSFVFDPLGATQFGIPEFKKPVRIRAYYKYKAGEKFQEGTTMVTRKDKWDFYAVLFDTTIAGSYLNGKNSLNSNGIVLMARIEDGVEANSWTEINLPFKNMNGLKVDPQKLKAGKYSFTIVMSSSRDAALFHGAVGSTLQIDEIEVFYE